ncbi:hypothetical protein B0J13DRAFT_461702 [Dactylonectria estremocensis]|uniref:C2H2-type domain-containing protein n=1 Tax=Dactylonectria estremocensis TaxID=1079267 RepID=A0A9P9D1F8_9HYPO|nr:hypothetical protein B0J13DRAFT_461702 [Dactylonectria estremocensis]
MPTRHASISQGQHNNHKARGREEQSEDGSDTEESEEEEEEEEEEDDDDDDDGWSVHSPRDDGTEEYYSGSANDESVRAVWDDLLERLFQLSFTLITEEFLEGQPSSTLLIYFSGILGFSTDCQRFQPARGYCTNLSGLIYIQRLLFLEHALPLTSYPAIGLQQRPPNQQFEQLNSIREKFMTSGCLSPLAEMHNLRNYGHIVAQTEPPSVFLHWSDDGQTVSYGYQFNLSMQSFRRLPDYFINKAEGVCAELMLGLQLDINLAAIKDDMVNREVGYSFVSHANNRLDRIREDLLVRVCTAQSTRIFRNGQWSWNAITAYLRNVTTLEEMILGGLYTACGQVPRLTELLSLRCENSPSAMRSIFVWNGSVIYILQHHKAKRSTNQEFYVVRFLPARLGTVVVKYLTCIRWIVAILEQENPGLLQLGSTVAQRDVLFQTPIGVTEKHVREVHSPFNRYDDRSAEADLNVTFAWQSGHRPLQRGVVYGLDGAFPHQLQPSLLRAYEWASARWHEFIHQASKNARMQANQVHTMNTAHSIGPGKKRRATFITSDDQPLSNQQSKRSRQILNLQSTLSQKDIDSTSPGRKDCASVCIQGLACILSELRILVCLVCRAAVRPGPSIEMHFRGQHKLKGEHLQAVMSLCSDWLLQDPRCIALPNDGTKAIPYLPVYNGFRCTHCIFMTISRKKIVSHYREKKHNIRDINIKD